MNMLCLTVRKTEDSVILLATEIHMPGYEHACLRRKKKKQQGNHQRKLPTSITERSFTATVVALCPFQLVKLPLQSTLERSVPNTTNQ